MKDSQQEEQARRFEEIRKHAEEIQRWHDRWYNVLTIFGILVLLLILVGGLFFRD